MNNQTPIIITTGTFIRAIIIGAIAYAVWMLRGLALLVLTAIVIASAIEPGVKYLMRKGIPRVLSVLLTYIGVFGFMFGIVYFLLPPVLADAQGLLSMIPQYLNQLNLPIETIPNIESAGAIAGEAQSVFTSLVTFEGNFTGTSENAFRLIAAVFGGLVAFVLIVVLSFYFAIQETGVDDFLRLITPAEHEEYVVGLWLRAKEKIGLWMQGQVLTSILGGVLAYLGLLILDIPYAFALALLTAAGMLVPIFGSILSAIPPIVLGFSSGGIALALLVLGLFVIINQFEAHIINPLVVNKVVGIPPLLVILALIIGGELAGFLGVLLAVPLAAVLREFLHDYDKGKRKARELVA